MQNLYDKQSISFAGMVQDQFRDRAKRKDRGVKRQGLLVLAQTSMPGVLIETGFITNPEEEKYLMSEEGQDYIASAIFRAFRDYKQFIESRSVYTHINSDNKTDTIIYEEGGSDSYVNPGVMDDTAASSESLISSIVMGLFHI